MTFLFDLDGTLLDRDQALLTFAAEQFRRFSNAFGGLQEKEYVQAFVHLDDRGKIWKDAVYKEIERLYRPAGIGWIELYEDYIARFAEYYHSFPGMHYTLNSLKQAGAKLGLVSNGLTDFQWRTIHQLKIEQYFQTIVISEAVGFRKPEPQIFELTCQRLGVSPRDCLFVGDNIEADIQGAAGVGMKTAWKRSANYDGPVISDWDFNELPEVLNFLQTNSDER